MASPERPIQLKFVIVSESQHPFRDTSNKRELGAS